MENSELQSIWKSINTEIHEKSKDELNLLLKSKAKQTINKFIAIMSISIVVSVGLLVFLTITLMNRQNDLVYLINNFTLGIVTIISLTAGLISWYKLQNNKYHQSLEQWLSNRIDLLSGWLTGKRSKLYLFLIPVLYILTVLSIHVYFEQKPFLEVLNTEDSVFGLIVAAPVGLFISYYAVRKIRKFQLQNLQFLKDLHHRIVNVQ